MANLSIVVFIDTNIYLNFYKFSHADLSTLKSLFDFAEKKHIRIVTTELLKDEFDRNRNARLKEALSTFNSIKIQEIPTLFKNCKGLYDDLIEAKKCFEKAHGQLGEEIKEQSISESLEADILIRKVFQASKYIKLSDSIYKQAMFRMRKKNPPGKNKELGDRINWESILQKITKKCKLVIISDDGDFCDELDNQIKPFLLKEWSSKNKGQLELFKKLNDFLLEYAPEFKLADQTKEDITLLIYELENSSSFAETHNIIEKIQKYIDSFTKSDLMEIITIIMNNNQIRWILGDDDIFSFLNMVKNTHKLDEEYAENLKLLLKEAEDSRTDVE